MKECITQRLGPINLLSLVSASKLELNSSFLGRLAYLNGLTCTKLLTLALGTRKSLFLDIDLIDISNGFSLLGNCVADSLRSSLFTTKIRKHGLRLTNSPYSVCIECLREKMFVSLESRSSAFHTCPIHQIETTENCTCEFSIQPEKFYFDYKNKAYICPYCKADLLEQQPTQRSVSTFQSVIMSNFWPATACHLKPSSKTEAQAASRLLVKLAEQILRREGYSSVRGLEFNKHGKGAREFIAERVSQWLESDWPYSLERDIRNSKIRLSFQEQYLNGNERWLTSALTNSESVQYSVSAKFS